MAEALLLVSVGSLLAVGVATLVAAALILRNARRSVELAGDCVEHLREEQARLLLFLRGEHQVPEEPEPERELRLKAEQKAERLSRECLLLRQEQRRLAEELERERRARRDAEQRIDHLEQELQQDRKVRRESSSPVPAGLLEDPLETGGLSGKKTSPTQKARGRTRQSASSLETTARGPAKDPPVDKRSRLGVCHPHPDDGVERGGASAGQARARSDASVEMFRRHYDKYLENYQGYVELAERLYRNRDNGGVRPGSLGEREWEEKIRRVNDGVERTTARLDILEEHNPELATDDERISRRTSIARRHSELERNGRRGRRSS